MTTAVSSFESDEFTAQLERTLGKVYYGCADVGECLTTADRIEDDNYESWYDEWFATAEAVEAIARESRERGHDVSAREAYLRATEYYRSAYFFRRHDLDDPDLHEAWQRQRDCFRAAMEMADHTCEVLDIPFEETVLESYFLAPDDSGTARPTVIGFPGYDSPVEESYAMLARAALTRGYNCLLFEGPGQGGTLYEKRLFFRPDYEAVVTPVVDGAVGREDVDESRLALVGRSFGGYLAPRAATAEHRLAALAADPAIYDLGTLVLQLVPEELRTPVLEGDPDADAALDEQLTDPHALEFFGSRMAAHGLDSLGEYVRELQAYTYESAVDSIDCPTFVADNESDRLAVQSHDFATRLAVPTKYTKFTDADGAGGHCEGMGQSLFHQRLFDWLDETLDRTKSS
ncbi:dipeptidyl aminopeptidase/acylaminoacyl peptidase [Natrialba hulunbeirensis JCM 10989]|uniref:Dipeptidyl aminopeptidase/acylaminoacyl peptidase n=1 Tax=Natrialba hulunbeirensis JCM 10989 TaxID=1227493 RepID=L9ZPZ1_9EURY|nr:alpha/beta hydrolase [Natrialba hulunbeirensis]ELY87622.1 dipeptidyl aminopeptidase/acylaminoacyl peptidase [Natrialba hulunbeirensis JCM 10989]